MPNIRKAPHRKLGDIFGRLSRADFANWQSMKESPIWGWLAFILLSALITFLMKYSVSNIPSQMTPNMIVARDIRADRNYEIVDKEATSKFKEEAIAAVLDIYDFNADVSKRASEKISSAFDEARKLQTAGAPDEVIKRSFEEKSGVTIKDEDWKYLLEENFNGRLEHDVISQIASAMAQFIVADKKPLFDQKERGVIVRLPSGDEKTFGAREISGVKTTGDIVAKILAGDYLRGRAKKVPYVGANLAALFIQPDLTLNIQETQKRKDSAVANVKNVVIKIESGEMIVRAGTKYEPRHIMLLQGIKEEKAKSSAPIEAVGTFLLIALVMLSTYYFAEKFIRKFAPDKKDLFFMGSILVLMLIIVRFSLALSSAVYDSIGLDIPRSAFDYAIPVAGAAMLIRFILNSETALVFSIVLSIFSGFFIGNELDYTAFCLVSSVAAAASIAYADKRSAIIKAGLCTAAVNIVAVIGVNLLNAGSITESVSFSSLFWHVVCAVVGGLSCSIFVLVMTPVSESVLGYTTDIKLLELANLNHPLLRELVIRAPGTYHHSHLVGILAEAASSAIGTNPLLVRVAAYYHDIGKIRKPLYFVENMREGESRHDKLSPHMSALIVSSHVKDGMELAKQYKIPKKIADMVVQHHGTKMISFFYNKAKELSDPDLQKFDEKDFRYPGPKPQTREAGILMLADAVEAAVRSLKEKSPTRIQETVENIINSCFAEGQLNECDLTLRDLNAVAKEFVKILMGIYHQRIEYPKEMLQGEDENGNV